jgi:hypothetical protein
MLDPRPAYAAADIVVGMGSSALRAMAHAKPVVVQGERGFSDIFDERTAPVFFWQGFYGVGNGTRGGPRLAIQLGELVANLDRRRQVGQFGLETVRDRFSLQAAAVHLSGVYEEVAAIRRPAWRQASEALRVGGLALANEVRLHRPREKRAQRVEHAERLEAAACPGR